MEVDISSARPQTGGALETTVVGTPVGNGMSKDKAVNGMPMDKVSAASPRHGTLRAIFAEPAARPWLLYGVYSFLSWGERVRVAPCISRSFRGFLKLEDGHGRSWQWMCECLQREALLHLPLTEEDAQMYAGGDGNWQALFKELWNLRRRFVRKAGETDAEGGGDSFSLAVSCRMRPPRPVKEQEEDGKEAEAPKSVAVAVTLPLHQRMSMLRQQRPELSHKEAMKTILDREREKKTGEAATGGEGDAAAEDDGFTASVLSLTPGPTGSVLTVSPGIGIRSWDFDHVFCEGSTQRQSYQRAGLRLAMDFLNGVSGSLIVYGQTGSGKTHTMFGPPGMCDVHADPSGSSQAGLVPRIANEVLAGMEVRRRAGLEVSLRASFVEIFGQDVSDLLGKEIGATRAINQRMAHRFVLDGQCEEPVNDRETFASLLARGEEKKRKASTAMNERSSRAHTMVILRLRQELPGQEGHVESRLFLVDLGGSERVNKSKANEDVRGRALTCGGREVARASWAEYYKSRERITETTNINKGLLTLKRCIQALNVRQQCAQEGRPLPRVPYADSKLTMLLEPALGGDARTAIVVCCSKEDAHAEETVQSLRFGEMCSTVAHERKDQAQVNSAVTDALTQIDTEIREVEELIRKKERWETREHKRVDVVDEMDNGTTVCNKDEEMELGLKGAVEFKADDGKSTKQQVEITVRGQVLVGAEAENARRDELLKRREKLVAG